MDWQEFKLGDIVTIKHGYAFKGEFFSDEPTNNILLTPGNFKIGGGFKNSKLKYYSGDMPEDYILSAGDVVVTMTDLSKCADTLGYSARIPNDQSKVYLHNQRIGLVRKIDNSFDLGYLYWLMRTEHYQKFVAGSATGATVKHTSPSKVYAFKFKAPNDKEIQNKIANILSAYDDLIECNLKRIKLLEEMAQITYEQWFVRMHFPGHETVSMDVETGLYDGWSEGRVIDLFELQRGFDLPSQDRENGEFPILASTGVAGLHSSYKVKGPGVVTGRSGTIGQAVYVDTDFWPLNTALWVRTYNSCGPLFVKHFLEYFNLPRLGGGSAVPSLDRKSVHMQKITIPSPEVMKKFESYASSLYRIMNVIKSQNIYLQEALEILLPRLMTGMIDIDHIELPFTDEDTEAA